VVVGKISQKRGDKVVNERWSLVMVVVLFGRKNRAKFPMLRFASWATDFETRPQFLLEKKGQTQSGGLMEGH
jgi:hypothetical protein